MQSTWFEVKQPCLTFDEQFSFLFILEVVQFGMNSAVGQVSFDRPQLGDVVAEKPFSEPTAQLIDQEVRSLIDTAFQRTLGLVTDKKEMVEKVRTVRKTKKVNEKSGCRISYSKANDWTVWCCNWKLRYGLLKLAFSETGWNDCKEGG